MFSARIPFWTQPVSSANDPYWTSVTFLENFETPQTAFVDSSTTNAAITVTSIPIPNYNTPFTGVGASTYYNGSSGTVIAAASGYLVTTDFTWECWVNFNSLSGNPCLMNSGRVGDQRTLLYFDATNGIRFAVARGPDQVSIQQGSTAGWSTGVWYHVAVVRSGNNYNIYRNGTSVASGTNSYTQSDLNDGFSIGYSNAPTSLLYLNGYISNARVVNGVAVYTSTFTPSTQPLPATQSANVYGNPSAAITSGQTKLLMNFTNLGMQNNTTFADISTYTATPTVTNTPYYAGLTPFTNTYPGSIYFNGSSNFSMPSNAVYQFGTGDFTVEFWMRSDNVTVTSTPFDMRNPDTQYAGFDITQYQSKLYVTTPGINYILGDTTLVNNTWYHVALSRISNSMNFYINGVKQGSTYTTPRNFTNQIPRIATGQNGAWSGYLSNIRIVKGVGVYTAAFTPSTQPLPVSQSANVYGSPSAAVTSSQTSLLIPGTTGGFQDLSTSGQRITNTTSTTSVKTVSATQQFKFGTQSNTLLPTAYQSVVDATSLQLGTGDFTIEGWIYTNASGVLYGIMNKGASLPTGWSIEKNTSNQLIWYSGSTAVKTSTDTIPASTWTYFAISRSGTNLYMFINGNLQGSAGTDSANYNQTTNMVIGATRALGNGLNGYLDDLRITKGVCRYTASFSAPTTAFPTS